MLRLPSSVKHGFTLIELLIVISILAILTGAVIPSFNKYTKDQNLKQAQEQVINDLRSIQNNALVGAEATHFSSPNYWGIHFLADQEYRFIISPSETCAWGVYTDMRPQNRGKLPGGAAIKNSGCIFFSFKNGDSSNTNGNLVRVELSGSYLCVRVHNTGLIVSEECP